MNMNLISKIFELKGMINILGELANEDEQYNSPMIESIESKINQIVASLEETMNS